MLTYDFRGADVPMYRFIYERVRDDIVSGRLSTGERLPSKRALAKNLGVSTITVESAYDQLISEGYVFAIEKRGYFVAQIPERVSVAHSSIPRALGKVVLPEQNPPCAFDFSSGIMDSRNFPFSVWAKLMRGVISGRGQDLLRMPVCSGAIELRRAIAGHLSSFRGMEVDPDQIIVGAGTEYLYGLLIKLLGRDKIYCVENPGYRKIKQIYEANGIQCRDVDIGADGISAQSLRECGGQIAHISPNHHFPTGITMPIGRRYEILEWAFEEEGRFIIEDDYDSEFRLNGKPVPPLQSIDSRGKVIYMNTFSKSLASTIRISYMVLPVQLANEFYRTLSFYSCTVPTFEQYTLAEFISRGFFEKHINRMRLQYGRKRRRIIESVRSIFGEDECAIIKNDSGLHFLLEFRTALSDSEVESLLLSRGIRIRAVSDYRLSGKSEREHLFILAYSNIDMKSLDDALMTVRNALFGR